MYAYSYNVYAIYIARDTRFNVIMNFDLFILENKTLKFVFKLIYW